jgi:hypothetical protein
VHNLVTLDCLPLYWIRGSWPVDVQRPRRVQLQSLKVTDYLVGPQLDDVLAAGQEITVSRLSVGGQISDFMQAEVL